MSAARDRSHLPAYVDLAVIGGGIIGAAVAWLATTRQPWSVAILERAEIGGGATRYSAGLALPYGRTPRQREMVADSMRLWAEWRQLRPSLPVVDVTGVGFASAARLDAILDGMIEGCAVRATDDARRTFLSRHPALAVPADQEMVALSGVTITAAEHMTETLLDLASANGARVYSGAQVTAIDASAAEHRLRLGDGRSVLARRVVVATGPWLTTGFTAPVAARHRVRIKKVAALLVDEAPPRDAPVAYFFDDDAFLLPLTNRRCWLFSFRSNQWECLPDEDAQHLGEDEFAAGMRLLAKYRPDLVAHCRGAQVFCDAYAPDWTPLIACEDTGIVYAGACAGAGVRLAPAIAAQALASLGS